MKRFLIVMLVAGLALAVGTAQALTLQPSVSTTQTWNGGTAGSQTLVGDANEDEDPYWDGKSKDFTKPGNIGNWIAKTGAFWNSTSSPGVAYPYVGSSSAGDLNIYFTSTDPNWAAIRIEVAGLDDYNYFGIYKKDVAVNKDTLLTPSSANHVRLFVGGDTAGAIKIFTPPWQDFGWYLATEDEDNPGTAKWAWFSQSSLNTKTADKTVQHFAFFEVAKNQSYYIGVEDMTVESTSFDRDYQDFVVFASVIPDASTWMLFLSGVPALALLRRRRG
ncbi:MAG: hypothetical protein KatS3mg023_1099 [Armatimonadota bacterium]|nr:MAG: hypothetical protein KatS3mg023_1099 [Armatimonadota bacterium]